MKTLTLRMATFGNGIAKNMKNGKYVMRLEL